MNDKNSNGYTLAPSGANPPTGSSYWVVEGRLLAGAYPGDPDPRSHPELVTALLDAGIRTFVNLMQESETDRDRKAFNRYDDLVGQYAADAICLRRPIRDTDIPSPRQMAAILDDIDASLRQGRPVYVHCWGGRGRTGTVVGCWMLRHGLATSGNVLELLAQLRRQDRRAGHFDSPENDLQRRFVKTWPQ